MNQIYNQSYTKKQIIAVLSLIKDCIKKGHYVISLNESRQENRDFIAEFNLNSSKQRVLLLGIEPEDFCHSLQNTKKGYEHEVLYVFVPRVKLHNIDGLEKTVDVYTKFNLLEYNSGNRTIVISLHRRKKPISYLFG